MKIFDLLSRHFPILPENRFLCILFSKISSYVWHFNEFGHNFFIPNLILFSNWTKSSHLFPKLKSQMIRKFKKVSLSNVLQSKLCIMTFLTSPSVPRFFLFEEFVLLTLITSIQSRFQLRKSKSDFSRLNFLSEICFKWN